MYICSAWAIAPEMLIFKRKNNLFYSHKSARIYLFIYDKIYRGYSILLNDQKVLF